jgi:hypothetical protein
MNHGIEPLELLDRHVPQIHAHTWRVGGGRTQYTVSEKACVQTGHVMPGRLQDWHHGGTEVTLMSRDEYSHVHNLLRRQRGSNVMVAFSTTNASA